MEAGKIVGWNVRRLRVARTLTLEELAHTSGVETSYLAKLERGDINASLRVVEQIRKALKVRFAELAIEPAPGEKPPKPLRAGRKPKRIKSTRSKV